MIEELIKNARLSSSGRKLLTSQQKAFIVEDWESSGLSWTVIASNRKGYLKGKMGASYSQSDLVKA
ncbi:MAG: hypothetical protein ACI9UV_000737 [Algoriphagus sp.]|jgi:hypothetical protein